MLWEFAFAQISDCIKRSSILCVCRKANDITKGNSGCHSFDFTYDEKLFSNCFKKSINFRQLKKNLIWGQI